MIDLHETLRGLKLTAQPKSWYHPPSHHAIVDEHVFTCCIENGRLTLAVSRTNPNDMISDPTKDAIVQVFGEPSECWNANYELRGPTMIWTWPIRPGASAP